MSLFHVQPGDLVFAAHAIHNDGSIPTLEDNALLAAPGARGVVLNIGHLEHDEEKIVFLVRFETGQESSYLGPAVGCWEEDLSAGPLPYPRV